jgi:hypothetical protein
VLGLESGDVGANRGIAPVALQEFTCPGAGIAEQGLVDESNRRRRAFDVEQDGADLIQFALARSGM